MSVTGRCECGATVATAALGEPVRVAEPCPTCGTRAVAGLVITLVEKEEEDA